MNYTIVGFAQAPRDWETANGQFRSYYLNVEGDDKTYELAQKRDKPAPNVGDSFEATVETREANGVTYYKLKRQYQQRSNGGSGRPRDPQERESIERQVAAKVASDLLVALMAQGTFKPEGVAALGDAHSKLAATVAGGIKV